MSVLHNLIVYRARLLQIMMGFVIKKRSREIPKNCRGKFEKILRIYTQQNFEYHRFSGPQPSDI
jgi:hypothetical protein